MAEKFGKGMFSGKMVWEDSRGFGKKSGIFSGRNKKSFRECGRVQEGSGKGQGFYTWSSLLSLFVIHCFPFLFF